MEAGEARNEGIFVQRISTTKEFKRRLSVRSRQYIYKARVKMVSRVIDNRGRYLFT